MLRTTLLGLLVLSPAPVAAVPAAAAPGGAKTTWRAEVELDEGSILVGEVHTTELQLRVGGRTRVIPIGEIVAADRVAGGRWEIAVEDGTTLTGDLLTKTVELTSLIGKVDIPLARAVELAVYPDGGEVALPAREDLVLYMNFDRRPRDVVRNLAGSRHHAEAKGVKWIAKGKRRGALEFDDPAQLTIPHHADLCPDQFTLAMWVRAADVQGNWRLIASKTDVGSWHGGYGFCRYPSDDPNLYFYAGHYNSGSVKEPIPNDEWVHLAGTFDGKQVTMYVNGEPSLPLPIAGRVSMSHTTTPFIVGGGGSYNWTGAIDEIVLYRRALSIQEIEKLMIAVSPPDDSAE